MKIRKATIGDLKKIQELNLLLFEKEKEDYDKLLNLDWTFGEEGTMCFKKHLAEKDSCAFVAEDAGEIVGYLAGSESKVESYRDAPKVVELDNMFILEEYRARGVGGMLYDVFVEWSKERRAKMLKVEASAGNKEAIGFYRKKGFEDYTLVLEKEI